MGGKCRFGRVGIPNAAVLALFALTFASSGPAAAGDSPAASPAASPPAARPLSPEDKRLLDDLKLRVSEWGEARREWIIPCPNCNGTGKIQRMTGRRLVSFPCSKCDGKGRTPSERLGKKLYYDLMSPAWRKRTDAVADGERLRAAEGAAALERKGTRSWRIDRIDLVDSTHGTAWLYLDGASASTPLRWIRASDSDPKAARWYLYSESVDGAWPDGKAPEPEPGDPPEPLPKLQKIVLDSLLEKTVPRQPLSSAGRCGNTLVVAFDHRDMPTADELRAWPVNDSTAIFRAVFDGMPEWSEIRLVFRSLFQEKFGNREAKPFCVVSLTRDTYMKIHFEHLAVDEAFALFHVDSPAYDGWRQLTR